MNKNIIISVIIPFKVKEIAFINNLIDCLLEYRGSDCEFVFVDDFTDEKLSKTIKSKIDLLTNSTYIRNKKNYGVSRSRNLGIEASTGEYIMFVDSDDLIDVRILNDLPAIIKNLSNNELLCLKMNYFDNEYQFNPLYRTPSVGKIIIAQKALNDYLYFDSSYDSYMFKSACGKIFSSNIIKKKHLSFAEGLNHYEDALFVSEYCLLIENATLIESLPFYFYRNNMSSASHSYDKDLVQQITNYYDLFKTRCFLLFNLLTLDTVNLFVSYLILNAFSLRKKITRKEVDSIIKAPFIAEAFSFFKNTNIHGCKNAYLVRLQKLMNKTPRFVWVSYIYHINRKYLLR